MAKKNLKGIFRHVAAAAIAAPLLFSAGVALAQDSGDGATVNPTPIETTVQAAPASSGPSGSDMAYLYPWVLLGLGALPALWWLLRATPPRPKSYDFPALKLLGELSPSEETPAKTPPWQLLLRMTVGAAAIVAMAQPLLDPNEPIGGEGPLMLVIDNGWASAPNWDTRKEELRILIDQADREGRQVIIVPTAPSEENGVITISEQMSADEAREFAESLRAQPWPVDREAAVKALDNIDEQVSTVWLSNSLDDAGTLDLARRLDQLGSLRVLADQAEDLPFLLVPPDSSGSALELTIRRPVAAETEETIGVVARAEDGRSVERVEAVFERGQTEAKVTFDLPPEIRNQLTQISLEGQHSAGAVVLLDERWRYRPVGIVQATGMEAGNPLLDEAHYVQQALDPYADVRRGDIQELIKQNLAVMVLTDDAELSDDDRAALDRWIKEGGTVLRFAGPHTAETPDSLLPVEIREGNRNLGGAMSWSVPAKIAPFSPDSPFYGLELPEDIVVEQQVLAQPGLQLNERTWARLEDGTPLVTAERRGEGLLVFIHTTADPDWSNLALSGLFVDMLRTVVSQSQGISGLNEDTVLDPWKTLTSDGRLGTPAPSAVALTADAKANNEVGPATPPGFYGDDNARTAHNLAGAVKGFAPLDLGDDVTGGYATDNQKDLTGPLLTGALGLLILDLLIVMGQRGMLPGTSGQGRTPAPNNGGGSQNGTGRRRKGLEPN